MEILEPGFHWALPSVAKIHTLDVSPIVSELHFSQPLATGQEVNLTFAYSFSPERSPVDMLPTLFSELKPERKVWEGVVAKVLEHELASQLSTVHFDGIAQFLSSPDEKLQSAIERATEELLAQGLSLSGVALREFRFADDGVAAQYVESRYAPELARIEGWSNTQRASKDDLLEENHTLEQELDLMRRTAERQELELILEGKLLRERRMAEGDLLVAEAQAQVAKELSAILFGDTTSSESSLLASGERG